MKLITAVEGHYQVVQAPDKITPPRSARDGRIQRRIQDHLSLLKRRQLTKVAEELKEAQITRQVGFADAPKHPQIGLEQGKRHSARFSWTSPRAYSFLV